MKNIKLMLTVTLSVLILLTSCKKEEAPAYTIPENPDVRNVTWGMTMDEVIFCEGKEPDEKNENSLVYKNCTLEKIPAADIEYKFYGTGKLLSSIVYKFGGLNKLDNRQLHNSYIDISEQYTKKYGKPIKDEKITGDPENKSKLNAQIYDMEFSFAGLAKYITQWKAESAQETDSSEEQEKRITGISLKFSFEETETIMEVWYESDFSDSGI